MNNQNQLRQKQALIHQIILDNSLYLFSDLSKLSLNELLLLCIEQKEKKN